MISFSLAFNMLKKFFITNLRHYHICVCVCVKKSIKNSSLINNSDSALCILGNADSCLNDSEYRGCKKGLLIFLLVCESSVTTCHCNLFSESEISKFNPRTTFLLISKEWSPKLGITKNLKL